MAKESLTDIIKKDLESRKERDRDGSTTLNSIVMSLENGYIGMGNKLDEMISGMGEMTGGMDDWFSGLIVAIKGGIDRFVDSVRDLSSDIMGVVQGWWRQITNPIQDFLTPIMAIGVTVWKMFKMIKRYLGTRTRGIFETIKDFLWGLLTKSLAVIAVGLGIIGAMIVEKFKVSFSPFTREIKAISLILNGLKISLSTFWSSLTSGSTTTRAAGGFTRIVESMFIGMATSFRNMSMSIWNSRIISLVRLWWQVMPFNNPKLFSAISYIGSFFSYIGGMFSRVFGGIKGLWSTISVNAEIIMGVLKGTDQSFVAAGGIMSKMTGVLPFITKWASRIFWPIQILISAFDFINGWINTQGNWADKLQGGIMSIVRGLIEPITKLTEWVLGKFGLEVSGLSDKILNIILPLFELIRWPFKMALDFVSGFVNGKGFMDGIYNGIKNSFNGLVDAVLQFVKGIASSLGFDSMMSWFMEKAKSLPSMGGFRDWMIGRLDKAGTTNMSNIGESETGKPGLIGRSIDKLKMGSSHGSSGSKSRGASIGGVSTPVSPAQTGMQSDMGYDVGYSPSITNTTMGGTPSPEAQQWFKMTIETNKLLQEWLRSNMSQQSNNNNNLLNSSNSLSVGGGTNTSKLHLGDIPTDVDNFGVLLHNKTWGLS